MQNDLFDKPSKLTPVQREMVIKITTLLSNMGCKYYIKTPDGEQFSLGIVKAAAATKAGPSSKFKHGERTDYVTPFIEKIKDTPGVGIDVPLGAGMDFKELQNIISSVAHSVLGKGMYQTEIRKDDNCVHVFNNGGIRV